MLTCLSFLQLRGTPFWLVPRALIHKSAASAALAGQLISSADPSFTWADSEYEGGRRLLCTRCALQGHVGEETTAMRPLGTAPWFAPILPAQARLTSLSFLGDNRTVYVDAVGASSKEGPKCECLSYDKQRPLLHEETRVSAYAVSQCQYASELHPICYEKRLQNQGTKTRPASTCPKLSIKIAPRQVH